MGIILKHNHFDTSISWSLYECFLLKLGLFKFSGSQQVFVSFVI